MKEKDTATLEAFFSLSFFYFFSSVTRAFPLSIKGKAGRLMEGDERRRKNMRSKHKSMTQAHG